MIYSTGFGPENSSHTFIPFVWLVYNISSLNRVKFTEILDPSESKVISLGKWEVLN